VKKIRFAKAVINKIGASAKDIFYLAGACIEGNENLVSNVIRVFFSVKKYV
jgi:hypothetical protein